MPIGEKLGILAILTKKFNVFKEKKFRFLADGGGHAPLCPPPGYATAPVHTYPEGCGIGENGQKKQISPKFRQFFLEGGI